MKFLVSWLPAKKLIKVGHNAQTRYQCSEDAVIWPATTRALVNENKSRWAQRPTHGSNAGGLGANDTLCQPSWHSLSKRYINHINLRILFECPARCYRFSRKLGKTNTTKQHIKRRKIIDNTTTEYICLQSRSNYYFWENPSFSGPPLKIDLYE
jgi:hypothetical protein